MEKQSIDGGVPAVFNWKDLPGETVMSFEVPPYDNPESYGFEFQVKELKPGKHFEVKQGTPAEPYFEASTPYRHCVYQGKTAMEALSALMRGMAYHSREGAIDPKLPHNPGAPIIQHAIHILTERLLWHVERRRDHLLMGSPAEPAVWPSPYANRHYPMPEGQNDQQSEAARQTREDAFNDQMMKAVAKDNEIVSALATAISALARVKDA